MKDVTVIEHSAIVNSEPTYSNTGAATNLVKQHNEQLVSENKTCDNSEPEVISKEDDEASKEIEDPPPLPQEEQPAEFSLFRGTETALSDAEPQAAAASPVKIPPGPGSRRYRKFPKTSRKIALNIGDAIVEETEDDLESEKRAVIGDLLGRGGGGGAGGSDTDDYMGKYDVTSNFADEILSEIYGETSRIGYAQCEEGEESKENTEGGETVVEEQDLNLSLTDEILEELYGKTTESSGCNAAHDQRVSTPEKGENFNFIYPSRGYS